MLQKIDLLKVCPNKDEAVCSLQLQGNWTSGKLMRGEINRPLKMPACHWAINSFPNYFSSASLLCELMLCPGDLLCLMDCGEATSHPCRNTCVSKEEDCKFKNNMKSYHADLFFYVCTPIISMFSWLNKVIYYEDIILHADPKRGNVINYYMVTFTLFFCFIILVDNSY